MSKFFQDIRAFNEMYKLPASPFPTMANERLEDFQVGEDSILGEEFLEGKDVDIFWTAAPEPSRIGTHEIETLTAQADWLGDMIVYCASEMHRYGLDPEIVLGIIMDSNASKLDENGKPIYDERGKVMKGPGYWKPEPKIRKYIEDAIVSHMLGGK